MLPSEIRPFAEAHTKNLTEMLEFMDAYLSDPAADTATIPVELLLDWQNRVRTSIHALARFEACMLDEVNQKELYRDRLYRS